MKWVRWLPCLIPVLWVIEAVLHRFGIHTGLGGF